MSLETEQSNYVMDAEPGYLRRRVYEETKAAVIASSPGATLIHVIMATAYAKQMDEQSRLRWVDEHRVW